MKRREFAGPSMWGEDEAEQYDEPEDVSGDTQDVQVGG
jgi:hypothetical protein